MFSYYRYSGYIYGFFFHTNLYANHRDNLQAIGHQWNHCKKIFAESYSILTLCIIINIL